MNMERCLWWSWSIFALVLSVPSPVRAEKGEKFDKKQVLAEWSSHVEKVLPVRWESFVESFWASDGKPLELERKDVTKVAINRTGRLLEYYHEAYKKGKLEGTYHNFWLFNSKYNAELKRGKDKNAWFLTKIDLGARNQEAIPDGRHACP